MRHLNYSHLHYFWNVANEGSIARAADVLHITPQTISGQLKLLDEAVGEPLFVRSGRGLVLSDTGRLVKQYADDIFALGGELAQVVQGRQTSRQVLHVGIVNSIAKLISCRILEPAVEVGSGIRLVCKEGDLDALLADLAVHRLDMVLSDRPLPVNTGVKAFNHELGKSPIAFFSKPAAIRRYRGKFPASLNNAPMLLPCYGSALRRALDDWFEEIQVTPRVVAEFDDSALLKMFGAGNAGLFPAPHAIADEIERMYSARTIGLVSEVQENYFAISPERRVKHPAVVDIISRARRELA